MILNEKYPLVYDTNVEYTHNCFYSTLKDCQDADYFFLRIQTNKSFLFAIPEQLIQKLKVDSSTFLVVFYEWESHLYHVDHIYQDLILGMSIPAKKIILLSDNYNAKSYVDKIAKKHNADKIQIYWSLASECSVKNQVIMKYKVIKNFNTLVKKKYEKSFIMFNRRLKEHRIIFVALLKACNLLEKGYVSFPSTWNNFKWENVYPNPCNDLIESEKELGNLIETNLGEICKIEDLFLDTNDFDLSQIPVLDNNISFIEKQKLYENTYFSIVSETQFFNNNGINFTEKTFKPIVFKHPFILLSAAFSLNQLRKLGYKTFHPYIDESYDQEKNDATRLKLILKEVIRLTNFTQKELEEFIDAVGPIVSHNFNVIVQKKHYEHLHKIG